MCVKANIRTMGCGKSLPRSPEDSETDIRNSGSFRNSSKNRPDGKKSKKKLASSHDENSLPDKPRSFDTSEKSSSLRKISNGKSGSKDKCEDKGTTLGPSQGTKAETVAPISSENCRDKANGATTTTQGAFYLLEVPNETYKDSTSRAADNTKSTSKRVHATTSQLEFFKMLDEKIEMGGDYLTSNEASEVSSTDEPYKK